MTHQSFSLSIATLCLSLAIYSPKLIAQPQTMISDETEFIPPSYTLLNPTDEITINSSWETASEDSNLSTSAENCSNFIPLNNTLKPTIPIETEFSKDSLEFNSPTSACAADLEIKQIAQPLIEEDTPTDDATNELENLDSAETNKKRWNVSLQPYTTLPVTVYGDATAAGRTVNYHLNTGQFLDILRVTASGRVEGWYDRFGFIFDGLFVSLQGGGIKEIEFLPNGNLESTLFFNQGIYDFAFSYRLGDAKEKETYPKFSFEPIIGTRLNSINVTINQTLNLNNIGRTFEPSFNRKRTWFTPMIGGKIGVQPSETLTFWVRGDYSGFGLGGDIDFNWNVYAAAEWWVHPSFALQLGYHFYQINYQNDTDIGLNLNLNGPYLSTKFYF